MVLLHILPGCVLALVKFLARHIAPQQLTPNIPATTPLAGYITPLGCIPRLVHLLSVLILNSDANTVALE